MNDQTLRRQLGKLRVPPSDVAATERALERALIAHTQLTETPASPWGWRDWLWPSPLAWGAMAALWIVIAVRGTDRLTNDSSYAALATEDMSESVPPLYQVFSSHEYYAFLRELQQGSPLR